MNLLMHHMYWKQLFPWFLEGSLPIKYIIMFNFNYCWMNLDMQGCIALWFLKVCFGILPSSASPPSVGLKTQDTMWWSWVGRWYDRDTNPCIFNCSVHWACLLILLSSNIVEECYVSDVSICDIWFFVFCFVRFRTQMQIQVS